jgi:uncharacterized OB-fold protein
MTVLAKRSYTAPALGVEMQAFWEHTQAGVLPIPYCEVCGKPHWYPRAVCPHCWGTTIALRPSSGRGQIYSYTVMRREKQPYVLAFVQLNEGVTLMTHIVDCDPDRLAIGQRVRVGFEPSQEGLQIPVFHTEQAP